ncbi:MAG: 1-acyl-sn-glycerol-3-phosphate acyltransferase [Salinispira sp.]
MKRLSWSWRNSIFRMIDVREIAADLRLPNFILRYLASLIHQREINAALREFGQLRGADFVRAALNYFDVKLRVHGVEHLAGLERPVLISNHPLGGLDGLALICLLFTYFSEVRLMVNDLLMNIHQMEELFLPVSKEMDGGMSNYRHGERYRELFSGNAAILHFPAGKCSRRIGGRVHDLPWNKSYVRLCRENSRPIVPCLFFGENSRRFYTIANLRRWFRIPFNVEMLFLVDEMFRKRGQTLEMRIGTPVPAAELCASDDAGNTIRNSASINADINAEIRRRVYALKQALKPAADNPVMLPMGRRVPAKHILKPAADNPLNLPAPVSTSARQHQRSSAPAPASTSARQRRPL